MSELLDKYNARRHRSLADIYEDLGRRCPFTARLSDFPQGYEVLVTQCVRGKAYGYPLMGGRRTENGWYTQRSTESVAIPDHDLCDWELTGMPFDDLERKLFVMDLHGLLDTVQERVVLNERDCIMENAPSGGINYGGIVPFGKYRGRTVEWLINHDPEYMLWASENIAGFDRTIYRQAS